jgi:hypothetical protein
LRLAGGAHFPTKKVEAVPTGDRPVVEALLPIPAGRRAPHADYGAKYQRLMMMRAIFEIQRGRHHTSTMMANSLSAQSRHFGYCIAEVADRLRLRWKCKSCATI